MACEVFATQPGPLSGSRVFSCLHPQLDRVLVSWRELGDRVSRSQFKEWLMEMQANDQVQLMGGQVPGVTQDQSQQPLAMERNR